MLYQMKIINMFLWFGKLIVKNLTYTLHFLIQLYHLEYVSTHIKI